MEIEHSHIVNIASINFHAMTMRLGKRAFSDTLLVWGIKGIQHHFLTLRAIRLDILTTV